MNSKTNFVQVWPRTQAMSSKTKKNTERKKGKMKPQFSVGRAFDNWKIRDQQNRKELQKADIVIFSILGEAFLLGVYLMILRAGGVEGSWVRAIGWGIFFLLSIPTLLFIRKKLIKN